MTLTILQLFQRYSELKWYRKIFIKRYNATDDEWETDWYDISQYLKKDSIKSIKKQMAKDNYSFGKVVISNCSIELRNVYGELSDEDNDNSIFNDWQRHNSKIKVVEGYVDDKTDPLNQVNVEAVVFLGLIDDKEAQTTVKYTEKFKAKDLLNVLNDQTMKDIRAGGSISATTINTAVYEIMNKAYFTKYFNVDNSIDYIDSGYNADPIDMSLYDDDQTVMEVLEDLAKGHSIFYIDSDDEYFYFKTVTPTASLMYEFKDVLDKRIKIDKYMTGADKVIEDWYWEDTNISVINSTHKYNTSQKMSVIGVSDPTQRANLLANVQAKTSSKKVHFDVIIPYFPIIKLLDRVNFTRSGVIPEDAFLLDIGRLDVDKIRDAVGSIELSATDEFYVRGITHGKQKTTIQVQHV